ncbi:GTP-binding protein LepA [Allomyces macrogynus ATCC 38327]|uniref:GTP-binding protein LepA n=1 Tax=Allomyces macrogynus (strain ATCC 38327) TaxID=578462 RepID=A0A0L0T1V7_ALLM3|nr:GTP-binding protein LepA [Allomyces macrogynus ATCC 38327]|eukprot:KNE68736.1 GTP-binding protein LepA [Allomyces macrogynus ATCC 38327]
MATARRLAASHISAQCAVNRPWPLFARPAAGWSARCNPSSRPKSFAARHFQSLAATPATVSNALHLASTRNYSTGRAEELDINLANFLPERIRNFSIIAHIDHGKSTLADRLLEITGTIRKDRTNKQVLDKLKVERERGITVKAQTVSMFHTYKGERYLLNLIDTPGHVDFSYEVSRSLSACQGALLLVDASQGIQAQTVANFYLAFGQDLEIVPILNKVDLPAADPERIAKQIETAFELPTDNILQISAKTGLGCDAILDRVIEAIPPPSKGDTTTPLRALLFDSWYDTYLGVICLFSILDGRLKKGDKVLSCHSDRKYDVLDVGIMHPEQRSTGVLFPGQVGYAILGMKSTSEAHIGDTFSLLGNKVEALPGFQPAKPMVFSGVFPVSADEFPKLNDSISKLAINDASVTVAKETSSSLGQGFRLGFLGTLHMDVFRQRLEQEYEANVICTAPTVPFKVTYKDGTVHHIRNPAEFPEGPMLTKVDNVEEPTINATILTPDAYLGPILELCNSRRGQETELTYIDDTRVMIKYVLPMTEVVTDFYDRLKSISSGFASFDYEEAGYVDADLVKLNVLLNSKPVDALASIQHRSSAETTARQTVAKLKDVLDRQLYEIVIQCAVGGKIMARETLAAMRKNVTAKCYGGDVTRKLKLLEKQKKGKARMKMVGNVEISQEAFLTMMKK